MSELELIAERLWRLIEVVKRCATALEQIAEAVDDPAAVPVYQVPGTVMVVSAE